MGLRVGSLMGLNVIVGTLELGCPVGWQLMLGPLVGVVDGLLVGWQLGFFDGAALC